MPEPLDFELQDENPSQGKEFTTTLQAPDGETLEAMIQGMQDYAKTHHIEQVEVLEEGPDPDGGFRAIIAAHNWNVPTWKEASKVAGKIAKGAAKGTYATAAGFAEGLGVHKLTPREVGKFVGQSVREVGSLSDVDLAFRDDDWFFGDLVTFEGSESQQEEEDQPHRKPTSRLPLETLMVMAKGLAEQYPGIYENIHYSGIEYSEFIGHLRDNFPEIYEDLREQAYRTVQARYPQYYGVPGQNIQPGLRII